MSAFTDHQLIDFLAGKSSIADREQIAGLLHADEELAARISLMAALSGFADPTAKKAVPRNRFRKLFSIATRTSVFVVLGVAFGLGSLGWAAWAIFHEPPLLQDNFNSNWLDVRLWQVGRKSVFVDHGYVRLMNRGSLVTRQEFPGPTDIRFKWRWIDHAGDPLYAENLHVALRTSGEHAKKHAYEILDGTVVILHGMGGCVKAMSPDDPNFYVSSADGSTPFPAGEWHDIRITDDGETIAVYVKGPAVDPKYEKTPVLVVQPKARQPKAHHIAVYNRELLADAIHESHIDDFRIDKLASAAMANQEHGRK